MRQYTALADINLGSMVEFALLNGTNRKSGLSISAKTGDPASFESYEEFLGAVKEHIAYATRAVVAGSHIIDEIGINRPVPALSLTFKDCIENARDYAWGGAKYNAGNGIIMIGVADLINSIAAVKHLVFDTGKISMDKIIEALNKDFEGFEEIRKMCLEAPK